MKRLMMFVQASLIALLSFNGLTAQTAYHRLKQPDGTTFEAVERGDEWLRFYETPEGHIVRRGGDGYFHFFDINSRGEFVATNMKAGIDVPQNVPVRPYKNPAVARALIRKIEAYNDCYGYFELIDHHDRRPLGSLSTPDP